MKKAGHARVVSKVHKDPELNPAGVRLRVLQDLFKLYRRDPEATLIKLAAGDQRGGHNRIFTTAQERNMAMDLVPPLPPVSTLPTPARPSPVTHISPITHTPPFPQVMWFDEEDVTFTNEDFHLFAMEKYAQMVKRTRAKVWKGPSMGHINEFKRAWGFTSKQPRISHVAKNPNLEEQMVAYRHECVKWCKFVGPSLFFNYDETFWRLLQNVLSCWGRRGHPHHRKTRGDNKAGFTLGVMIAADGTKLPLQLVARGTLFSCS
jgi:hypothetical protein